MRDRAIRDLLDRGWTPAMLGELFGLTARRVRQIRDAARDRVDAIRDAARYLDAARCEFTDGP